MCDCSEPSLERKVRHFTKNKGNRITCICIDDKRDQFLIHIVCSEPGFGMVNYSHELQESEKKYKKMKTVLQ